MQWLDYFKKIMRNLRNLQTGQMGGNYFHIAANFMLWFGSDFNNGIYDNY